MRQLAFLDRFFSWLFPNNQSDLENKQEHSLIDAVNKSKNYYVTYRGGFSMDSEELSLLA
jgi:hypothetical protein